MYSDKVLDHFLNPPNAFYMPGADGCGTVDGECGDKVMIFIRVRNEDMLTNVSFLVFGCVAAIATASATTVLAQGKSIKEASKISEEDVCNSLDGLPVDKMHCSNLGVKALRLAIEDYYQKTGRML